MGGQTSLAHCQEGLLIGIGARRVEVVVGEGGQRLHVQLVACAGPIKALGHEVPPTAFLEQAAGAHVDAGGPRPSGNRRTPPRRDRHDGPRCPPSYCLAAVAAQAALIACSLRATATKFFESSLV